MGFPGRSDANLVLSELSRGLQGKNSGEEGGGRALHGVARQKEWGALQGVARRKEWGAFEGVASQKEWGALQRVARQKEWGALQGAARQKIVGKSCATKSQSLGL